MAFEPWVVDPTLDLKKNQPEDTLLQVFCNAKVQFKIPKEKFIRKIKPVKNPKKRIIIEEKKPEKMVLPKIFPEPLKKNKPRKKVLPKVSEKDSLTKKRYHMSRTRSHRFSDNENDTHERDSRKRKAEILSTDDPNAPAVRRSARQRYRPTLYMSNTDEERLENEEDDKEKQEKYEQRAAPVPDIVSFHSEVCFYPLFSILIFTF